MPTTTEGSQMQSREPIVHDSHNLPINVAGEEHLDIFVGTLHMLL